MPTVDEPGLQQGQRQLVLGIDPETVVAGMRVALVKFEFRPATRISVGPDIRGSNKKHSKHGRYSAKAVPSPRKGLASDAAIGNLSG